MMKKRLLNLLCIGCIACGFAACSDDDKSDNGNGQNNREENATLKFNITQKSPGTYAPLPTESATAAESNIGSSVAVYVFDEDGVFEKYSPLSVTATINPNEYTSDVMKISSGRKYIYVFANMASAITTPSAGELRTSFEKRVLNNSVAAMTTDNQFYIGVLETHIADVISGTTETTPQEVPIKIGRLAAKIELQKTTPEQRGTVTDGSFDFTSAEYRLINEATGYYLVGQSSIGVGNYGNIMTSPHFTDGYPIGNIVAPSVSWSNAKAPGEYFYTKENTHTNPMHGSATSVQYRVQYTPGASEVYDLDGKSGATLSGKTFWMATVGKNKEKYLFNQDPSGETTIQGLGDIESGSVKEYTDGYAYYVIPIADKNEGEAAARYAVVRNYYYLLTINSIARLGNSDPDEITTPPEPINDDAYIYFTIEVLPWYKVEQIEDL